VRIPFPVHIPLAYSIVFALTLLGVQLAQGTSAAFAATSFCFIVVATVAFNLAGGFSRPSGGYVFFYAVFGVILGLCWKAFLGEPADSNLELPIRTMMVFLAGISAMLGAVFISQKISTRRSHLLTTLPIGSIQNATIGCTAVGIVFWVLGFVIPREAGSIFSALSQLNRFLPIAVILGTIYEIRRSGGKRSVNLQVLIAGAFIFVGGILAYSKEGIFTPLLCWLVAAGSQRYRLSFYKIAVGLVVVAFMVIYLVPYSQYGRDYNADNFSFTQRIEDNIYLLSHLEETREKSYATSETNYDERANAYYNTPQGFIDRLQMISIDGAVIALTERNGTYGLYPIIADFENLVPHFLWRNKPFANFGNLYAHELGELSEDDFTTGISFTPTGDAYHQARWSGVLILAPLLWCILFALYDSLCGDARQSPWGLLIIAYFAHIAPEGMLGAIIYSYWIVLIGLIFMAYTTVYVMPIIGTLIKGPEKTGLRRIGPRRGLPGRVSQLSSRTFRATP
jgi:hypothetical protein